MGFSAADLDKLGYRYNYVTGTWEKAGQREAETRTESTGGPGPAVEPVEVAGLRMYEVEPVGKPRMTQRDKWGSNKRPCVAKYHAYKDELRDLGVKLGTEISVVFYLRMPKSWTKAMKAKYRGLPHDKKPDLDNLVKALMDACLEEDSAVWKISAEKYWADRGGIAIL